MAFLLPSSTQLARYSQYASVYGKLLLLLCLVGVAFVACMLWGSIAISLEQVFGALLGDTHVSKGVRMVVVELRLVSAVVAMFSGMALGVCGLVMQTIFGNPLADPSLLGVNTGASIGVAIAIVILGGSFAVGTMPLLGQVLLVVLAIIGSLAVLSLILLLSRWLRDSSRVLIVGLMVGFGGASVVGMLQYLSSSDGLQRFYVWGMGQFDSVGYANLPFYLLSLGVGILALLTQVKWLNALLMGEAYAENLGLRVRRTRTFLLAFVGSLTAIITAYCGPVAFLGLAAPHLARLLLRTANHHFLLPGAMLVGSALALICHALSHLPIYGQLLPINVLTPLVGVPIVLYLVLKA